MLETEEVDDDYFTPISSTSLANIFSTTKNETGLVNPSLKYVPQTQNAEAKTDETKFTECVFACAVTGYEWYENVYTPKGSIGLAILKTIKTGYHNIVLYDSNKSTLSCTTISSSLEVDIKGKTYISYFDNLKKYWSIYAKENEVSKVIDILKTLNVILKKSEKQIPESPETNEMEKEPNEIVNKIETKAEEQKESDTDSLVNKKTKASILSRMASMGQAILPIKPISSEKTSDSSDNDDSKSQHIHRHKPVKSVLKKTFVDRFHTSTIQNTINQNQGTLVPSTEGSSESFSHLSFMNSKLIPTSSNFYTNSNNGNDFNMLMSEQRINNSELRINMNRISDKVDHILEKVKVIDTVSNNQSGNMQINIMQKLLTEYEHKLQVYENIIKAKEIDVSLFYRSPSTANNIDELNKIITQLEKSNAEKDTKLSKLFEEVEHLKRYIEMQNKNDLDLTSENTQLKSELKIKNEECNELSKKLNSQIPNNNDSSSEVVTRIKKIMNDSYQTISANFENEENFSGETVKIIIAKIIKQATIDSIRDVTSVKNL